MSDMEMLFFWIAIGCYILVTLFYLYWFINGEAKGRKVENILLWVGFLAHLEVLVARTIIAGHLPVRTLYELNITVAWLAIGVFLLAQRIYKQIRLVGMISVPFAFLVMGWGFADSPDIVPLTAAYKSNWLVVHVLFALLSTACYVFASGTSILYLLKSHTLSDSDKAKVSRNTMIPDLPKLEKITVNFVLVGFLAGTIMLVSGSIWAKLLWGSYWGWDPVETWSLISWLVYGIFLHLRFTFGWHGRKLALLCLFCLVTNIVSFWTIGIVSPDTYHDLDKITRPVD